MSRFSFRRILAGGLLGSTLTALGVVIAPAASAETALPRPVVSHTVVQANEYFSVSVTGCTARPGGSTPWLTITSPDGHVGDGALSPADGAFEFRELFGPNTPKGTYRLQVVCDDYVGKRTYPLTAITFGALPVPAECTTGCATVAPGQTLTPGGGVVPGEKRVLRLTGYLPFEKVRLVLHSTPQDLGTVDADASGTLTVLFTVPAGTPAGGHNLVVTRADGSTVSYPVTIAAAPAAAEPTLANTGADVTVPLVIGSALVLAGAGTIVAARRREGARA